MPGVAHVGYTIGQDNNPNCLINYYLAYGFRMSGLDTLNTQGNQGKADLAI